MNRSVYEVSSVQDLEKDMVPQVGSIASATKGVFCAIAKYWDYACYETAARIERAEVRKATPLSWHPSESGMGRT